MTTATDTQSDLFAWAKDLERENKRIAEINAQRVRNRGISCSRPTIQGSTNDTSATTLGGADAASREQRASSNPLHPVVQRDGL
jgi:hypothetical protein